MPGKTTGLKKAAVKTSKLPSSGISGTANSKGELLANLEHTGINPDDRAQMIAELAYYRAQERGFGPDGQLDDWLEAESVVDTMLSEAAQESIARPH